jgi:hypothetical protein
MNPASAAARLADEQLPELMGLIKEADSVELWPSTAGAGILPAGGPAEVADDQ